MAIETIESLREHLQWAIEIEHSTIPPYLCALYSIKEGTNRESWEVIESIFMEEMLHMTLAANVLNAIGGRPVIDKPDFIPKYPTYLPHSNKAFQVSLSKFSKMAVDVFMMIEKPEDTDAVPEDDNYHTIGQFYEAIEQALIRLCDELGEENVFTGNPNRQIRPDSTYYGGSGFIVAVENLETALKALEEVKEQGEGLQHEEVWDGDQNMFHPERPEVAHYFRFNEILEGRNYQEGDTPQSGPTGEEFEVDWDAVHNMKPNPRSEDYPEGSDIRQKMDDFNHVYCSILHLMHRAFNGQPEFLSIATGAMYELRTKAIQLMKTPTGDGLTTVGPSFEYVPHIEPQEAGKIIVRKNGPYVVYNRLPLVRKEQIISEHGEPLSWRKTGNVEIEDTYALCRCGQSTTKPFCDGTHVRIKFDGTETAATNNSEERRDTYEGTGITVHRDNHLCMDAGFCGDRFKNIIKMMGDTDDSIVRGRVMAMVERCPSGTYTYTIEPDEADVEPSLPAEIAITIEGDLQGPIWVTGGIKVQRSDGQPFQTRNRVTLCRCGHSKKKPLCDGMHRALDIKEEK